MTSEAAWTKVGEGGRSILFGRPKAHSPQKRVDKRDLLAGGLLVLFGAGTVAEGLHHPIGTLRQMGSGFFPVALGVILIVLGVVIAAIAAIPGRVPGQQSEAEAFVPPDWRGFFAIVTGIVAFILLGAYFGLAPAAFGLVFVSAIGDRSATLKSAFVLALAMTAVATVLFWYLLQIQFPLLRW